MEVETDNMQTVREQGMWEYPFVSSSFPLMCLMPSSKRSKVNNWLLGFSLRETFWLIMVSLFFSEPGF